MGCPYQVTEVALLSIPSRNAVACTGTSAAPCPHPPLHPLTAIRAIYRDRGVQAGCFFGALTPRWYLGPNGIGGAIARSFFYWPSPPCSVWLGTKATTKATYSQQRDSPSERVVLVGVGPQRLREPPSGPHPVKPSHYANSLAAPPPTTVPPPTFLLLLPPHAPRCIR